MHGSLSFLVRGLIIGFAIAAPVGAIGVLCIRRTLADGRRIGFVSGLGAATADTLYGAVAALGLTSISGAVTAHVDAVRLVGGIVLCVLGVRAVASAAAAAPAGAASVIPGSVGVPPDSNASGASHRSLAVAYASTLGLTLTNPSTILSFAAIFAGLGLVDSPGDRGSAVLLMAGVFAGSAAWWLLLSTVVGSFRRALTPTRLRWVNIGSGMILAGFGLVALLSGLR